MREDTKPIIYIIDDEEAVLKALRRLILSMGMDVETFSSGEEFLNTQIQSQNACLIVDAKMPGMGGLEIHRELKSRALNIPVILITAYDSDNIRRKAKKVGIAGYFRKPVDDRALLDSIQWALSNRAT